MTTTLRPGATSLPTHVPAPAAPAAGATPAATDTRDADGYSYALGESTESPPATFTPASASKGAWRPFAPPPSPQLIDERTANSPAALRDVRETNSERIKLYKKEYASYLDRYVGAVESAPDLERVKAFGPPASFEPAASLPVAQRARYDDVIKHDGGLANQLDVHAAIGERVLKERGQRIPGFYAFFEGKTDIMGQSVTERFERSPNGDTRETKLAFTVKSPEDLPVGVEASVEIDPHTGEPAAKLTGRAEVGPVGVEVDTDGDAKVKVKAGLVTLEADSKGKVAMETGVEKDVSAFGTKAKGKAVVGSSYDGASKRVELYAEGSLGLGDVSFTAKAGGGAQLLTKEYVQDVIDPNDKGFFDDAAQVRALRSTGR